MKNYTMLTMNSGDGSPIVNTKITGTKSLLDTIINDLSDSLLYAWKEAITNSIDSGASEIRLQTDTTFTILNDNGTGIDILNNHELLTTLGNSSKKDNSESVGKFGVGKSQIIGHGKVTIISNGYAIHYDIKNWGLTDVYITTKQNAETFVKKYDTKWSDIVRESVKNHNSTGTTVCIKHYDTTNLDLNKHKEQLQEKFKYISMAKDVELYIDDSKLQTHSISEKPSSFIKKELQHSTFGTIYMNIGPASLNKKISIYSNGIYVDDLDDLGFSGDIITENNLRLNLSRDSILQSNAYEYIKQELEKIKVRICDTLTAENRNSQIRKFMVNKIFSNSTLHTNWNTYTVFKSVSGSFYSLSDIIQAEQISFSEHGNYTGDRLEERGYIILDQKDPAVQILQQYPSLYHSTQLSKLCDDENLQDEYTIFRVSELSRKQRTILGVARYIATEVGINRKILYGQAVGKKAWTDGSKHIIITDTVSNSDEWIEWVPDLFKVLLHEFSHTEDTMKNVPNHGNKFAKEFRHKIDSNWDSLTTILQKIQNEGIEKYEIGYINQN